MRRTISRRKWCTFESELYIKKRWARSVFRNIKELRSIHTNKPLPLQHMSGLANAAARTSVSSPGSSRAYVAKMARMRRRNSSSLGSPLHSGGSPTNNPVNSPPASERGMPVGRKSRLSSSPVVASPSVEVARTPAAAKPSPPVVVDEPMGWYSGVGGAMGLDIRLEANMMEDKSAVMYIRSASQSIFWDREIKKVTFTTREDEKSKKKKTITWSKELMEGLKGSVVSQLDGYWDRIKDELALCIWLKVSRWVPAVPLYTTLKKVLKPVGPYPGGIETF